MKRFVGVFTIFFSFLIFFAATPQMFAQDSYSHAEVGAFAEYFRFDQTSPVSNFVGLGGRVAFNLHPSVQLEAEMGYDFARNFTNTFNNGASTTFVQSRLRTLHGLFGPKFQTGSGPLRVFLTGKVGFENFTLTNQNAPSGFTSAVGLDNGQTNFAVYPGGGIELFGGPIGVRAEIGDDIYFNHGTHNDMRVSFGPQFRF
ncbi:MAG TPA: hypothetical protein VFO39_11490 [Candidatus Sulfotelmatobacter sp.]|nr:hypothetical protein [Candidatus Sulfotelmatobacter sp.]